ncbi:MAG: hypothetical protein QXP32_09660 [Nitrososphaeria archaeon]
MRERKKPEEFKEETVTVASKIPRRFFEIINEKIVKLEYTTVSDYIRDLIREDLKKRNLI